jgi:hypothetical protein
MSPAEQLIAYASDHRPADVVGAGDVRDPAIIAECLAALLKEHLERTAPPAEVLEMMVPTPRGYERVPASAAAPPPFDPANCATDDVAMGLALLVGYLRDTRECPDA